ncbi:MAG: DUF6268 family outer membrane beta-barrel protein [Verrucomicrobiia bacterium]
MSIPSLVPVPFSFPRVVPMLCVLSALLHGTVRGEEKEIQGRPEFLFLDATHRYAPSTAVSGENGDRTGSQEIGTRVSILKGRLFLPITSDFLFATGPEWSRFDFDGASGAIPERLYRLVWQLGGIYRPGGATSYFVLFNPGLYTDWKDISSEDLSFTGLVVASTSLSSTFDLQYGFRFAYAEDYPLLPVAGFRWKPSDEWTFNLTAPLAEIAYSPTETWRFSVGFGLDGSTFRMAEDYGRNIGRPDLSKLWLSYREIRTFVGVEKGLGSGFKIRGELGWYIDRRFEFDERVADVSIDGSGYASLQLSWAF